MGGGGGGGNRAPVTEYDEMQELEAARERNDLDVTDLREMSVTELRQVGRDLELDTRPTSARTTSSTGSSSARPSAPATTTRPASSTSSTRASASCAGTASCPARTTSTSAPARSAASACGSATASPAPSARPREAEKYWGLLRVDSVNGVDTETARRRPVFDDLTPVHPDVLHQPRDATRRTSASG